MKRRCVVTVGVVDRQPADHPQYRRLFSQALANMKKTLADQKCDLLAWEREFPRGSPLHRTVPFAFKPFAFQAALERGYELVLWLDASVRIKRPLEALFAEVERAGHLLFVEEHSVGEYCKDAALAPLGIDREASFRMPSCWACAMGLDLSVPTSRRFLEEWTRLAMDGITFPGPKWSGIKGFPATASKDPRVKGHRYDQTAASVLALRLGMQNWKSKAFFGEFFENERKSTYPGATVAPKPFSLPPNVSPWK